jgi:hypothetical protein
VANEPSLAGVIVTGEATLKVQVVSITLMEQSSKTKKRVNNNAQ